MLTFLPLMVHSVVPGGLGRLLLSCASPVRLKAANARVANAAAIEKFLVLIVSILSCSADIIAQREKLWEIKIGRSGHRIIGGMVHGESPSPEASWIYADGPMTR